MPRKEATPTGKEVFFPEEDIIVSKTDLKGKIIYANVLFESICGYTREELLNQPHSIIRHPDMPRCIFKFMWDTLQQQREIFAYVINMCANGTIIGFLLILCQPLIWTAITSGTIPAADALIEKILPS
ncbi:MAG: PAS domain S-box protein [Emcibacter sp.]|nr:PAS domain S-box protein [Emcibacter sp.]